MTPMKLVAFFVVLAAAFGGGALLGSAVGPEPPETPVPPIHAPHDVTPGDGHENDHGGGHP